MDAVKGIGGLILICFGIWLFIKLIFHPMLFELDLQNKGKKGISLIITGIQVAGIIAMYICYGEHNQEEIDASKGFTAIVFVIAVIYAAKRAKRLGLSRKEKWMLILAQVFSPITIVVILLLVACALEKIGNLLEGIFGDSDD